MIMYTKLDSEYLDSRRQELSSDGLKIAVRSPSSSFGNYFFRVCALGVQSSCTYIAPMHVY